MKSLRSVFFFILACHLPHVQATIIDFDDLSPGTVVSKIAGVSFTSNISLDLIVSNGFDTTSGSSYLGVDDGGFEVFFPGDVVTLEFDAFQRNFGINFISAPLTPEGRFSIVALANSLIVGSISSLGPPSQTLPDGGEVFSLGLELNALHAFDEIKLLAGPGFYSFSIDDIVFSVPIPSTFLMFTLGLLFISIPKRSRQQ